jgi:hypothetical protein
VDGIREARKLADLENRNLGCHEIAVTESNARFRLLPPKIFPALVVQLMTHASFGGVGWLNATRFCTCIHGSLHYDLHGQSFYEPPQPHIPHITTMPQPMSLWGDIKESALSYPPVRGPSGEIFTSMEYGAILS